MKNISIFYLIKQNFRSIIIALFCLGCSLGLLIIPHANLNAQIFEVNEIYNEPPCKVKEIIHGESKGIFGCWGSDTNCKTKCFKEIK